MLRSSKMNLHRIIVQALKIAVLEICGEAFGIKRFVCNYGDNL